MGEAVEQVFPSTTWEWKRVKVRRPAGGQNTASTERRGPFGLPPRNPRDPLTIKVKYRGGSEAYYEIHARGRVFRRPGTVALHDIMQEINCSDR